jgi:hypothetical protein
MVKSPVKLDGFYQVAIGLPLVMFMPLFFPVF